jgi:hypothetical protein
MIREIEVFHGHVRRKGPCRPPLGTPASNGSAHAMDGRQPDLMSIVLVSAFLFVGAVMVAAVLS